jgi:pyruvate-formate lyase-activating enzyme
MARISHVVHPSTKFLRSRSGTIRLLSLGLSRRALSFMLSHPLRIRSLVLIPFERLCPFPPAVGIGLTTACNLQCTMCRRILLGLDKPHYMSWSTYRLIIEQISQHRGVAVVPVGEGESLLHPSFLEMMGFAKAKGIRPLILVTNGTLLTPRVSRELLDIGMDEVRFSIDGATRETYEKIRRGASFEQVVDNACHLLELRKQRGTVIPRVQINYVLLPATLAEVQMFTDFWLPRLGDQDEIFLLPGQSYSGQHSCVVGQPGDQPRDGEPNGAVPHAKRPAPPCLQLWKRINIRWNGEFKYCHGDVYNELGRTFGDRNIYNTTIADAWTSPELARFRRQHLRGLRKELPVCSKC